MEEKFREIMTHVHIEVEYNFYLDAQGNEQYDAVLTKGGYPLKENDYLSASNLGDLLDSILKVLKAL